MNTERSIAAALAALALALASAGFGCAPALAGYSFVGSFGSAGSGGGQFSEPGRLAVEGGTGDVLVADESSRRVEKFGPAGEYLFELNGAGAPVLFSETEFTGVAVDNSGGPSGGDVYVATGNSNSGAGSTFSTFVDKFKPSGSGYEYACRLTGPGGGCNPPGASASEEFGYAQASLAVGPDGEVYVAQASFEEMSKYVVKFNAAGEYVASLRGPLLSAGFAFGVAVDPTGRILYVVNLGSDVVKLTLNAAGDAVESEAAFDEAGQPLAVAVEPATGDVFVIDSAGGTHVSVYSPAGELLEEFGKGQIGGSVGIAYSPFNRDLYVSDLENNRVEMFKAGAPEAKTGGVSAAQPTSATLQGMVYPNSEPTVYYFEYGTAPGALTAKTSEASAGSADSLVAVQAQLTGLSPEATYYYRLVATNRNGTTVGEEESFTAPQPEPATGAAVEVTADAATVQGTVNPGTHASADDTVWCFQYGTDTGYGLGFAPVAGLLLSGGSGVQVSATLTGLQPGTTYHYRLIAVNDPSGGQGSGGCHASGGVELDGADGMFTTSSIPTPPVAVTGAASGVSQNAATISGTVDPEGSRTVYQFQIGIETSYGAQVFGDAGSGSEAETVTLALGGLQPGTTYHYRLVASSQGGTIYGADQTFTTSTFPSALLAAPATPPLIATPAITFPSTTKTAPAKKTKKAKQKRTKRKRRAKRRQRSRGTRGH